jgi:uncharacterized protein (TIGR02145 family)
MKAKNRIWLFYLKTMVIFLIFLSTSFKIIAQDSTVVVNDIDGNVYKTVKIGTQTWMAENLKTTKYSDSTSISLAELDFIWAGLTIPAYCWYNNDSIVSKNASGALYNWYAVNTNKLCPTGWHVPTDMEWEILWKYLKNNGYGYNNIGMFVGKSMAATSAWNIAETEGFVGNDQASNNRSGFTGLPGGIRANNGVYSAIGISGDWWSSSEFRPYAWFRRLHFHDRIMARLYYDKKGGLSVRCLKD